MSSPHPPSPIEPLSPLNPISPWPSIPPASDDSPTPLAEESLPNPTEVYASIAILGSYIGFALYLFWALVPPAWGWTGWLPDRQWALIVPCWMLSTFVLMYWSYGAAIVYNNPSWESPKGLTDPYDNSGPAKVKKDN
ncbi:hypothetical protein IAR50_006397 [Cryptococcus sp. DSM 104548]